jgi:hypothetical protein
MDLCEQRRRIFKTTTYPAPDRAEIRYELPLAEIIYDCFDALKSRTKGYASFDYELSGYKPSRLVKLDILLNGEMVDALSMILFADNAYPRARRMTEKLRDNISRQLFEVPVQAAIGGKIIARETVKALRKDVLAKCYGGDITRKKKLLEKQKEGKKKMRRIGSVELPKEAFMACSSSTTTDFLPSHAAWPRKRRILSEILRRKKVLPVFWRIYLQRNKNCAPRARISASVGRKTGGERNDIRERTEQLERDTLSPYACLSAETKGRDTPIPSDGIRTEFQRDRDRILHCKAFRRSCTRRRSF